MLKKYNQKRDFSVTDEPIGKVSKASKKQKKKRIFVIQFHQATTDHYDFRLEFNGVLLSWAVPKGLSNSSKDKRLAVHVEDHPLSYAGFEGEIPKNQYGAGLVEIFDKGFYEPLTSFRNGLKNGKLEFILHGEKFSGEWHLVRMDEKNWLIIKSKNGVSTPSVRKSVKPNPFKTVSPMLALLSTKIPSQDYLFEIKYDGYRILTFAEKQKITLKTRNNVDYTSKFQEIEKSLTKLCKNHTAVLDGEVVSFDENGRSNFSLLQEQIKHNGDNLSYVIFDILALDGKDLRDLPLLERKEILKKFMKICPQNLIFSSFVIGKGKQSFNLAKKNGLEGIVAKRTNSAYKSARTDDWLKIKCYNRQEFVIGGFTTTSKNKNMSAILLGYYDKDKLVYVGKVGTGFDDNSRKELRQMFNKIVAKNSPFVSFPNTKDDVHFVKPKLVCEVQFAELTKDGVLRQPSFIELRTDKKPKQIFLEKNYD